MKYPQLVSMPSAISDWLEEQLESRGIDAVVYTRYVLSLLHRDYQDLNISDPDLPNIENFKGEVDKRSTGRRNRKRAQLRNGYAMTLDQLRRSAAVRCLKSASEQNCGIESLVDELCMKLKQVEYEKSVEELLETPVKSEPPQLSSDLVHAYYTAFPPLDATKTTEQDLYSNKAGLSWTYLTKNWNTMPNKCYFNNSCSTRIMAKSVERSEAELDSSSWDQQVNWHNKLNDDGYSTDTVLFDDTRSDDDLDKLVAKFDRSIEALWSPDELTAKEDDFQDVPVDIHELLSSPSDNITPIMKTEIQKPVTFLQCGFNIMSSIWSQQENNINETIAANSFWNHDNINTLAQNKANTLQESLFSGIDQVDAGTKSYCYDWNYGYSNLTERKWSDAETGTNNLLKTQPVFYPQDNFQFGLQSELKESYTKLNHQKESSLFREVKRNENTFTTDAITYPRTSVTVQSADNNIDQEDDLLTSLRTHFCPIKLDDSGNKNNQSNNLPDGSTFDIRASPDKIVYKRTDTGSMFLDGCDYFEGNEETAPIEYMEYKGKCPSISSIDSYSSSDDELFETKSKFVLKFRVRQNEKYCQTDDLLLSESPQEVPAKRRLCDDFTNLDEEPVPLDYDCEEDPLAWPTELSDFEKIWSSDIWTSRDQLCGSCGYANEQKTPSYLHTLLRDELEREGEQLLSDISVYIQIGGYKEQRSASSREERKRRHSASLRPHTMAWHPIPQHFKALRSFTF